MRREEWKLEPPDPPASKARCADCRVPYVCEFEPRVGWCPVCEEFVDMEGDLEDEFDCFRGD